MTTIVHRTPGLLDTRAFTVMGMSAKPTTGHPIGQFGTGLKYSIAGLLRSGASVSIWIGREHWQFELETEDFRGENFVRIVAWVRSWGGLRRRKILLPYASNLGPHWTWWMWLRELHSNTLDEGGSTVLSADSWGEGVLPVWEYEHEENGTCWVKPADDTTLIVVTHPDYATAWRDRADVFLPGATPLADAGRAVLQVLPTPSKRLYYRGVRALELRLPALYTYNVLEQTPLTEDRTMQEWWARHRLGTWLVRDCTDQAMITAILQAGDDSWEHELELSHHLRPSADFEAAAARCRRLSGRAGAYISHYAPPPPPDTRTFWERRGRRWRIAEEQILDERGSVVLQQPESLSQEDWRDLSEAILMGVRPVDEGTCPTCHQHIDRRPPPRPAVVGDLYAGLRHDWVTHWPEGDDFDGRKTERCSMCGVTYDENAETDQVYGDCPGPAWMQPVVLVPEEDCPGHVASERDSRVCGRCDTHIDSLRPPEDDDDDIVF